MNGTSRRSDRIYSDWKTRAVHRLFLLFSLSLVLFYFVYLSLILSSGKKGQPSFLKRINHNRTYTHTIFTVTSFDLFVHFVLCPLRSLCDSLNRSLFVEIWLLNWIVNSMATTTKTKTKRQKSHNLWCAIEIREKWAHKYKQPSLSSEIVNAKAKTDFFSSSFLNGNRKNIMAES